MSDYLTTWAVSRGLISGDEERPHEFYVVDAYNALKAECDRLRVVLELGADLLEGHPGPAARQFVESARAALKGSAT